MADKITIVLAMFELMLAFHCLEWFNIADQCLETVSNMSLYIFWKLSNLVQTWTCGPLLFCVEIIKNTRSNTNSMFQNIILIHLTTVDIRSSEEWNGQVSNNPDDQCWTSGKRRVTTRKNAFWWGEKHSVLTMI